MKTNPISFFLVFFAITMSQLAIAADPVDSLRSDGKAGVIVPSAGTAFGIFVTGSGVAGVVDSDLRSRIQTFEKLVSEHPTKRNVALLVKARGQLSAAKGGIQVGSVILALSLASGFGEIVTHDHLIAQISETDVKLSPIRRSDFAAGATSSSASSSAK